jgi:hypothetical protein
MSGPYLPPAVSLALPAAWMSAVHPADSSSPPNQHAVNPEEDHSRLPGVWLIPGCERGRCAGAGWVAGAQPRGWVGGCGELPGCGIAGAGAVGGGRRQAAAGAAQASRHRPQRSPSAARRRSRISAAARALTAAPAPRLAAPATPATPTRLPIATFALRRPHR